MADYNRRAFLKNIALGVGTLSTSFYYMSCNQSSETLPNFIIIFVDDMGYGDIGQNGHPTIKTPNLEKLKQNGVMMTQFYTAASVCTPSRAALLTGRYPIRTGMVSVLSPKRKIDIGLPHSELTIAKMLKKKNYATSIIGKWHLGHTPDYMPARYGFDYFYGLLYSNDMDPVKLYRNEEVVEYPVNQNTLTKRYTEEAVSFINKSKNTPFFLYLAHTMPHTPLGVSDKFKNHSKRGLYGDVVEELDWSVGQIVSLLEKLNLTENTFIMFTSDNGPMASSLVEKVYGMQLSFDGKVDPKRPWNIEKHHGGSAGLFRGGKATTFEGGMRVPCIVSFPRKLPEGEVCTEVGTTMDIFSTCLMLAGVELPNDRPIDGKNLIPVLRGEEKSKHKAVYYYRNDELCAVRSGKYKLHFKKCLENWEWQMCNPPELYDLEFDPSEKYNIGSNNPKIVEELSQAADNFKTEIERLSENKQTLNKIMNYGSKK